jgi:cobalt transporter subunit CbtA
MPGHFSFDRLLLRETVMQFRRLIMAALTVGFLASLVLSAAQIFAVNPIIFAAESFEVEEMVEADHDHGSHHHDADAWAPADGSERTSYTLLSNFGAGIGYAAILLALMAQIQQQGLTRLTPAKGLLWGLSGFLAFFLAPGLGLPPEIPGAAAAKIEHRQVWWMMCVFCMIVAMMLLAFAPKKLKALAVLFIIVPYLVNAPHLSGPMFSHPDAAAVTALNALHSKFIVVSALSNIVFWSVLGALAAWALNRWVLADQHNTENGETVAA